MLKQIFIFGTITTLLSAAFAGDLPDASSLGARGVSAGLDLNVELAMEMDREFADILPRATSTNFQVGSSNPSPFPPLFLLFYPIPSHPKLTIPDIHRPPRRHPPRPHHRLQRPLPPLQRWQRDLHQAR